MSSLAGKAADDLSLSDLATGLKLAADSLGGVDQETRKEDHIYVRLGGHFTQSLFKQAKLTEKLTVLPRVTDFGEYRLTSEFSVETPLAEKLSLRLSLQTDYDSDTGHGDDEMTNTFVSALRYSF